MNPSHAKGATDVALIEATLGDFFDAMVAARPDHEALVSRHEGLRGRLVTDEGGLHRFVNVYVNDEDVRFLVGLETPLKDGDSVTVLPAVAGGAR